MTPTDARQWRDEFGLASGAELASRDDATLAQALVASDHGAQRIASQLMVNDRGHTLPLNRSFQIFGQRYTVDSHVFSSVVDQPGGGRRQSEDALAAVRQHLAQAR